MRLVAAVFIIVLSGVAFGQGGGVVGPADGHDRREAVWARKGLVRNPVAIALDPWGRMYIAETDRAGNAVTDTRQLEHLNAVEEDLRLKTVEDRLALIERWIEGGHFDADYFTREEGRVSLLQDTDGDGIADTSGTFAGGFNEPLDGIASGVLWQDGTVFLTNIPHLWALRDTDDDGVVDERESLSYGYGVRWCFYGHDLHGLTAGPDGRIYYTIGDRGFNVETREGRRLVGPERGGVFRCWPDGSGLELYHEGLRNPQELAFDTWGDLFTGDNNSDSGDRARVVHIVEGGDSGWRQDVQSLPSRGAWNRERMWELAEGFKDARRPAWSLAPVALVTSGPSGFLMYPGVGESSAYEGALFLVDFYGSGSKVHTFRMKARGAWFDLVDQGLYYDGERTFTDLAWGYDGRLYLSDWGGGWGPNPNGEVVTITNETVHADEAEAGAIAGVRSLFEAGFGGRGLDELLGLLAHRDARVRLASQYEIAKRGVEGVDRLNGIASGGGPMVQRVHATWCLGQVARGEPGAAVGLAALLSDSDGQIRRQAVRTLGDLRMGDASALRGLLTDGDSRVRYESAIALGRLADAGSIVALLDLLESNDDEDPVIRHGASYALSLIDRPDELIAAMERGRGAPARLGAVIALRRMGSIGIAAFLADEDARVATEAARGVYDMRIDGAMPALARLLDGALPAPARIEPMMRRVIEANVLLRTDACVERLARFAAGDAGGDNTWRVLALDRIGQWADPVLREGVWGHLVELPAGSEDAVRHAVVTHLAGVSDSDEEVASRIDALRVRYALELSADEVLSQLADGSSSSRLRLTLLEHIAARDPDRLSEACDVVLDGESGVALRCRARELLAERLDGPVLARLEEAIAQGEPLERQHAVGLLRARAPGSASVTRVLQGLGEQLVEGTLDRSIALEVYEASASSSRSRLRRNADRFNRDRADGFDVRLLAAGGAVARGHDVFFHHESAQCVRCHAAGGQGGEAGPDLTTVGSRLSLAKLVESVVEPGAMVAAGYGETSAMPRMTELLSPAEARDVVAYLSSLRDPSAPVMTASLDGEGGGGMSFQAVVIGMSVVVLLLGVVFVFIAETTAKLKGL